MQRATVQHDGERFPPRRSRQVRVHEQQQSRPDDEAEYHSERRDEPVGRCDHEQQPRHCEPDECCEEDSEPPRSEPTRRSYRTLFGHTYTFVEKTNECGGDDGFGGGGYDNPTVLERG